ncbi:MAG: glycosyltransferase family 39 protein [Planctomycetes bacterium]|nr:glycosyltransferase family 39 protein [Planctomycetota bacterium]
MLSDRTPLWPILTVVAIGFFTVSVIARMEVPAAQDELCWLGAVDTWHDTGVAWDVYNPGHRIAYSPHLYLGALELSYSFFSPGLVAARVPGLLAGVATLLLAFVCARRCAAGDAARRTRFATLAVLICASTPVLVQACAIIDIDNTILVPILLALVFAVERLIERPTPRRAGLTVALMALALWGRVTTPVILVPLFVCASFFAKDRRARWSVPLSVLGGVGLFFATWSLYCALTETPFSGPFLYTWAAFADRAAGGGSRAGIAVLVANGMHLVLWVGGVLLALLFAAIGLRAVEFARRRELERGDLFALSGAAIVLGYSVVGGTPFGFPKYHCPGFPLLAVAAVAHFSRWDPRLGALGPARWLGVIIASAAVQSWIVGDLLYLVRVTLREARAWTTGDARSVLVALGWAIGWAFVARVVILALISVSRRREWGTALLAIALGSGLGSVAMQNRAEGSTGYSYGTVGTAEVAERIQTATGAADRVIAPAEVLYLLPRERRDFVPNELWADAERLAAELASPTTGAFAVSIGTNTVAQLQTSATASSVQSVLSREYVQQNVGSFRLWLRRAERRGAAVTREGAPK